MRVSEASLALIRRLGSEGQTEYLTQWNDRWEMFALVGGHVEFGESFRECCIREIAEELELEPDVCFRVAALPVLPRQEYTAFSKGAGVETTYRVELYDTVFVTAEAVAKVAANTANRWLCEREVRAQLTDCGQPVSAQVGTVLMLFGVLPVQ